MIFTWALFSVFNILTLYLIVTNIVKSEINNIKFFFILTCIVINLIVVWIHVGRFESPVLIGEIVLYVLMLTCGLYATYKLNKLLVVPTRKAKKWTLSDEDKNRLPIKSEDKKQSIAVYFISLILAVITLTKY